MMKKESGITILVLSIMIILGIIILSTAIYSGVKSYQNAKVTDFTKRLEIVEERIKTASKRADEDEYYAQELNNTGIYISDYVTKLGINASQNSEDDNYSENYKFISNQVLKESFQLKNVVGNYVINVKTGEVFSAEGIEYNDKMVYSLSQLETLLKDV